MEDIKQVIVVRKDLKMNKGKLIAQGSHASLSAIIKTKITDNECYSFEIDESANVTMEGYSHLAMWLRNSFTKVCLAVNSEEELFDIYNKGLENGYIVSLILDDGRTCFNNVKTYTCLAFEPLPSRLIDTITGELLLF